MCVSVVPLLLLFCLCGGAAALENMKPIPYDTKQQLISYHTEGQGEDKVLSSLSFGVHAVLVLVKLEKHIAHCGKKNNLISIFPYILLAGNSSYRSPSGS